mmetsp:Transcript_10936/g.30213  ORF Transcript_10936/g.30213 Transcript_10936/m.30213 type:complete len:216 (+) Transcript_10936:1889-2536(+)
MRLKDVYGGTDFKKKDQCDFVAAGCDGVGVLPAFRRMDCADSISDPAIDFYLAYEDGCLGGSGGGGGLTPTNAPDLTTAPTQRTPPVDPTPAPSPTSEATEEPYTPPEDDDDSGSSGSGSGSGKKPKKKKSHFFRNFIILCLLAGGVFVYYKKRNGTFNFDLNQYRPTSTYDYDGGMSGSEMMYGNLNSSTSFQPPSLPPPPAAMGPNNQPMSMT